MLHPQRSDGPAGTRCALLLSEPPHTHLLLSLLHPLVRIRVVTAPMAWPRKASECRLAVSEEMELLGLRAATECRMLSDLPGWDQPSGHRWP